MASFEIPGFSFSLDAAADLTNHQFKFVVVNSSEQAALPGSTGLPCVGVVQNNPVAGEAATIMGSGISKVVSNGSVAAGEQVAALTTTGKARQAVAGDYIQGTAITGDGGVDGAYIAVLLKPQGVVPA